MTWEEIAQNQVDIIFAIDTHGKITNINRAIFQLLGYKEEEVIGKPITFFLAPEESKRAEGITKKSLAGKTIRNFRALGLCTDGRKAALNFNILPLRDSKGNVVGSSGVARDMRDVLRLIEERSRSIIETTNVLIVGIDLKGRVTIFNKKCEEVTGYAKEEVLGKDWFQVFLPERFRFNAHKNLKAIKKGKLPRYGESPILTKDGKERLISWSYAALKNEKGEIVGALASGEDITERKRAEEEIRQYIDKLLILCSIIQDITSTLDLKKVLERIVKRATKLIGGDAGSIALLDEEKGIITYPYHYNMPEELTKIKIQEGEGLAGHVIKTKKPIIIEDYPSHPAAVKEFVEAGLKVLAAVPVMAKDKIVGVLGIFGLTPEKRFSKIDLELLEGVGKQAAIAIENAMMYGEIQKRVKELEEFYDMAVGRELKMIELEKEIERLKEELERKSEGK